MDFEATQALALSDYDDETDDEVVDGEKKEVGYLKVIKQKGYPMTLFPIYEGLNLIGRDGTSCNVHIANKALSKEHACVEVQGGTHLIYDKGSRNKTKRGNLYLTPEVRYELKDEENLLLADVQCIYMKKEEKKEGGQLRDSNIEIGSDDLPTSEHSSDILMPTQPYNSTDGSKPFALGASTFNYVEDSDLEDEVDNPFREKEMYSQNVVGDTPMASEPATQYIPESDSDLTDEEVEVKPKSLDFDNSGVSEPDIFAKKPEPCLADQPTQAYVEDSDATTDEDVPTQTSDRKNEPTQLIGVRPTADEPTQVYTMEVSPLKSAMKKSKQKCEEPTQVYQMGVETAAEAQNILAKRRGKVSVEEDNVSEFGDNAPTQTYAKESEKPTPRKITWGNATLMAADDEESTQEFQLDSETQPASDRGDDVDPDAPTQVMGDDILHTPSDGNHQERIAGGGGCEEATQLIGEELDISPVKSVSEKTRKSARKPSHFAEEATQILGNDTQILEVSRSPIRAAGRGNPGSSRRGKSEQAAHLFGDTQVLEVSTSPAKPGGSTMRTANYAEESTQLISDATQILDDGTPTLVVTSKVCKVGGKPPASTDATQLLSDSTQLFGEPTQILSDATQILDDGTPTLVVTSKVCKVGGKPPASTDATQLLSDSTQLFGEPMQILSEATQIFEDQDTTRKYVPSTPADGNIGATKRITMEFNPRICSTQIRPAHQEQNMLNQSDRSAPVANILAEEATQVYDENVGGNEDGTLDYNMDLGDGDGASNAHNNTTLKESPKPPLDPDNMATQAYGNIGSDSEPSDAESEDLLESKSPGACNKSAKSSGEDDTSEQTQTVDAAGVQLNALTHIEGTDQDPTQTIDESNDPRPAGDQAPTQTFDGNTDYPSVITVDDSTIRIESSTITIEDSTIIKDSSIIIIEDSAISIEDSRINKEGYTIEDATQTVDESVEPNKPTSSDQDPTQTFDCGTVGTKHAQDDDEEATQAYGLDAYDSDQTDGGEDESNKRESAVFGKPFSNTDHDVKLIDEVATQAYGLDVDESQTIIDVVGNSQVEEDAVTTLDVPNLSVHVVQPQLDQDSRNNRFPGKRNSLASKPAPSEPEVENTNYVGNTPVAKKTRDRSKIKSSKAANRNEVHVAEDTESTSNVSLVYQAVGEYETKGTMKPPPAPRGRPRKRNAKDNGCESSYKPAKRGRQKRTPFVEEVESDTTLTVSESSEGSASLPTSGVDRTKHATGSASEVVDDRPSRRAARSASRAPSVEPDTEPAETKPATSTRQSGRGKKSTPEAPTAEVPCSEEIGQTTTARKRRTTGRGKKSIEVPAAVEEPSDASQTTAASKRRTTGREKKSMVEVPAAVEEPSDASQTTAASKRRTTGRGKKSMVEVPPAVEEPSEASQTTAASKRTTGRGKKSAVEIPAAVEECDSEEVRQIVTARGVRSGSKVNNKTEPNQKTDAPSVGKRKTRGGVESGVKMDDDQTEQTDNPVVKKRARNNKALVKQPDDAGAAGPSTGARPDTNTHSRRSAGKLKPMDQTDDDVPKKVGRRSVAVVDDDDSRDAFQSGPAKPVMTKGRGKRVASPVSSLSSQESTVSSKRRRTYEAPTAPRTPRGRRLTAGAAPDVNSPSLRQRNTGIKVAFTGVTNDEGSKIVKHLGWELNDNIEDCTHLVTDKVRRTVKFLCGVARGIPIVDPQWLHACKAQKACVDSESYLVNDPSSEASFGFKLKDALDTASEHRMLTGWKIYVTKSVLPDRDSMKRIVTSAGGQFTNSIPKKSDDHTAIVSCEKDRSLCKTALKNNLKIVSAEFILTGILRQEVNVTEHALFNEASESHSSQAAGSPSRRGRKR